MVEISASKQDFDESGTLASAGDSGCGNCAGAGPATRGGLGSGTASNADGDPAGNNGLGGSDGSGAAGIGRVEPVFRTTEVVEAMRDALTCLRDVITEILEEILAGRNPWRKPDVEDEPKPDTEDVFLSSNIEADDAGNDLWEAYCEP